MKTTFLFTQTLVAGLLLAGLFVAVPATAQERPDCVTCACAGNVFAKGCSIVCCKPMVGDCPCGIWENSCRCVGGLPPVPEVYEQNIHDFGAYLCSAAFTSPAAMNLANDIQLYLKAYASGSIETFYTVAERMETNTRQLTVAEKQLANQWIVARGGRPNTIL